MGYVKEPEGVDFVIQGKPLTAQQKKELSEFIRADKKQHKQSKNSPKTPNKSKHMA